MKKRQFQLMIKVKTSFPQLDMLAQLHSTKTTRFKWIM